MSALRGKKLPVAAERCWSQIGVHGDRSCPELALLSHCRHCSVFAQAARGLLDRPLPDDYQLDPASLSAESSRQERAEARISTLVFELSGEVFGIELAHVVEAVECRATRRVPRRSGAVFRGLVNIHGQLELYASLSGLLGLATEPDTRAERVRMIVLACEGRRWVIAVDRVLGVRRYSASELRAPPATLALGGAHVRHVVREETQAVALLDSAGLFAALEGALR
jgi:chemotaxis-related protein WspD